ncbi:MAG TPA: hypothetical protein VEZ90_02825 [Blastocatellia bacterium]|nr:hypothetical protein [Blastocatellia bacterium]
MKRKSVVLLLLLALCALASSGFTAAVRPVRTVTAASADPLQSLPDGVGAAVVDISQLTSTNLWTSLTAPGKTPRVIQALEDRLATLGLKVSDLQSAAVSFSSLSMNGTVMAVSGNFNQDDILSRLKANTSLKLSSETYKNLTIYTVTNATGAPQHHSGSFAFPNPGTVVLGSSSEVRAAADVTDGSKPSMASDTSIQSALGEAGQGTVKFALVPPAGMFSDGGQADKVPLPNFSSIKLIFGTLSVDSGIDLNATLRNDTADHAQGIAQQLNDLLTMVKGMLGSPTDPKKASYVQAINTVTISTSGTDVKIAGNVSSDVLAKLIH